MPRTLTVVEELLNASKNEFIDCTDLTARVVDQLIRRDQVEYVAHLLGRIVHFDSYSEPTVRSWLASDNPLIAGFGALLLAERYDMSPDLVDPVCGLLLSSDDLLRFRAGRAIDRSGYNEKPIRSIFALGRQTVERLVSRYMHAQFEEPAITDRIKWQFEHLLFDSPSAVEFWCDAAEGDTADATIARATLARIHWITDSTWDILVSRFRTGSPELRFAILESAARLAYLSKKEDARRLTDQRWASLWHAIQDADLEALAEYRLLPVTHEDVLQVAAGLMSANRSEARRRGRG